MNCDYTGIKCSDVSCDLCEKIQMQTYNKAIDDFVRFANTMPTVEEEDGEIRPMWLEEMAEQLKTGGDYENLEKKGRFIKLPCKVGDTVYCIYERYTKCSENEQEFDEYSCQGCECLECDSHKEYYMQSQKAYSLDWIVSNLNNFGKIIFLTQEEAEQKLKEMESD